LFIFKWKISIATQVERSARLYQCDDPAGSRLVVMSHLDIMKNNAQCPQDRADVSCILGRVPEANFEEAHATEKKYSPEEQEIIE